MRIEFLGWNVCLLASAAAWLWQRNEVFPESLVVVPTAQAGRRLRAEICELATRDGSAVFGLKVVTPAFFLEWDDPGVANDVVELLAWLDVFEGLDDWSAYAAAFPEAPDADALVGLARTLCSLRQNLQASGLLIRDAARPLMNGGDTDRWQALSAMEEMVEMKLRHWGYSSRSQLMKDLLLGRKNVPTMAQAGRLFLVGITEAAEVAWAQWARHANVTHVLGADVGDRSCFDARGVPNAAWLERQSPFPGRDGVPGSVVVAAELRGLARQCVTRMAETQADAKDVAMIACDAEIGGELLPTFAKHGWQLHVVGQLMHGPHTGEWLRHWCALLRGMDLAALARIIPMPESSCLTSVARDDLSASVAQMRDEWLVSTPEDVERIASLGVTRSVVSVSTLRRGLVDISAWRERFLHEELEDVFADLMNRLVEKKLVTADVAMDRLSLLRSWQPLRRILRKSNDFWLDLLCNDWPPLVADVPADRVLDVQGWLEAPFDQSPHLVLCGLSEGVVPSSPSQDPWLSESARKILKLVTGESRAARDTYLFHALCANRVHQGRVDVFLSKQASDGSVRRPSRILLHAKGKELAERVRHLFSAVEDDGLDLVWQRDWQWTIPWDAELGNATDRGRSISVTALRDYLSCPVRFYLKHALKLQERDPERGEWNARDFGNIMHLVLEKWGLDVHAREIDDVRALSDWLLAELNRVVARHYGENPSLAIRIQETALSHRLQSFASRQCEHYGMGWRIKKIEMPFSLELGRWTIRGKVDRIDQHAETGVWQMWDYKSGNMRGGVIGEHSKAIKSNTVIPEHLGNDPRLLLPDGKSMWTNLQLPLYAASRLTSQHPEIGYISMGESESLIAFDPWDRYDEDMTASAFSCALMILEFIDKKVFWPPAEKPKYDDFRSLAAGATLHDMLSIPAKVP